MNHVEAVLVGAGSRGMMEFGTFARRFPQYLKFVAVVEPDPQRRNEFAAMHNIPEERRFADAAELFARTEGTLPAPESSHAIKAAIDEALKCKETGEAKNILFGLTGTGYFDMVAYEKFHNGEMSDYIPTDEDLAKAFATLPKVD